VSDIIRYHVALVYSAVTDKAQIYVDGVETTYTTQNTIADNPGSMGSMGKLYVGR
jgi:hypothetical protein